MRKALAAQRRDQQSRTLTSFWRSEVHLRSKERQATASVKNPGAHAEINSMAGDSGSSAVQFTVVSEGYDRAEVQAFVRATEMVCREMEHRLRRLNDRVADLETRLRGSPSGSQADARMAAADLVMVAALNEHAAAEAAGRMRAAAVAELAGAREEAANPAARAHTVAETIHEDSVATAARLHEEAAMASRDVADARLLLRNARQRAEGIIAAAGARAAHPSNSKPAAPTPSAGEALDEQTMRSSRYRRQSARLPHIGAEAGAVQSAVSAQLRSGLTFPPRQVKADGDAKDEDFHLPQSRGMTG